jgi:hypothetical protein
MGVAVARSNGDSIELTTWATGFCSGSSSVRRVPLGACIDASTFFFPGIWAVFSYPQSPITRAVMSAPYFTDSKCGGPAQGITVASENSCEPLTTSPPWLFGGYYDVNVSAGTTTGRVNCTDNLCENCAAYIPVQGIGNECLVVGYGLGGQNLYATFSAFSFTSSLFNAIWYNDSSCSHSLTTSLQLPLNQCLGSSSASA